MNGATDDHQFGPMPPWRAVVAATVRAAYAWSKRHEQPGAMREAARMTGVVMAAHGPGKGPVTPAELAEALHRPLGELPCLKDCPETEAAEMILLENGQLTAAVYDLACEYSAPLGEAIGRAAWLPTWTRMRADQIRQEAYTAMIATGRQEDYVASRKFLIEHPAGQFDTLREQLSKEGARLAPYGYEEIPEDQLHRDQNSQAWWFPCPVCRWPMAVTGDLVRCRYRPHSASYRIRRRPASARPALDRVDAGPRIATPKAALAAGARCVNAGIWRFVVVPGAAELRLYRALDKPGVEVQLWPGADSYDLHVKVGRHEYKADLKEYQSIGRLVDHLTTTRPTAEVVLPVTHEHQLSALENAVPHGVRVTTETRFRTRILNLRRRTNP
ncbi:hypothetical protein [Amycolatopsis sp. GA6-003]|uniref:restriction endonuclease-related protein n=1 Tax=Amycolatopsis sp. GA6-003 TaxID=2652444 RepID=UPI003917020F